jgi:hypothetical protein
MPSLALTRIAYQDAATLLAQACCDELLPSQGELSAKDARDVREFIETVIVAALRERAGHLVEGGGEPPPGSDWDEWGTG